MKNVNEIPVPQYPIDDTVLFERREGTTAVQRQGEWLKREVNGDARKLVEDVHYIAVRAQNLLLQIAGYTKAIAPGVPNQDPPDVPEGEDLQNTMSYLGSTLEYEVGMVASMARDLQQKTATYRANVKTIALLTKLAG